MMWMCVRRAGCVGVMILALCGMARAAEPTTAPPPEESGGTTPGPVDLGIDDTDRLYFQFVTGMNWVLDKSFAGDAKLDGFPDLILGGGVGYNISRHWGAELQFQGGEPDIRSASRGKIREISIISSSRRSATAGICSTGASSPTSPAASAWASPTSTRTPSPSSRRHQELDRRRLAVERVRLLPVAERRGRRRAPLHDLPEPDRHRRLPGRPGGRVTHTTGDPQPDRHHAAGAAPHVPRPARRAPAAGAPSSSPARAPSTPTRCGPTWAASSATTSSSAAAAGAA